MSIATDFILNGITQMENMLDNPVFTYKGEDFACVPNTINDVIKSDKQIGYDENVDFRMTVRLNQFTSGIYPQLTHVITYNGTKFVIKEIKTPPHQVYKIYICEKATVGK